MTEQQAENALGLAISKLELRAERQLKCMRAPNLAIPYSYASNAEFGNIEVAENDEQWEVVQPKQKSGHFARLMPLIAQYLPIFDAVFRKLTQKFFSHKIPVTAAAILIFIGFAACSTRGFAYDNMSGTPH